MRVLGCLLIVFLAACQSSPDGFEERKENVYRELRAFGEGDRKVGDAHTASLNVYMAQRFSSHYDYMLGYDVRPVEAIPADHWFLNHELASAESGDSIRWYLPYSEIKGTFIDEYTIDSIMVADTARIELIIAIQSAYTKEEYFNSPRYLSQVQATKDQQLIMAQLEELNIKDSVTWFGSGWQRVLKEGEGDRPNAGDHLILGFTGSFLDGTVFDVADDSLTYIYFDYGKPDQVIEGIERSVGYMRRGERREVWLPSAYAFGSKGSEDIVPPNTPVRFELHLVDLLRDSI
ncbi:FKBP-type peptidyl-prolyl cis-trans isomerase [Sanyastnella coralliicola]|uniref:FKBP-type peptidyl-prolyl cis-trans isomerase n=1 Tax=Sanyastnella coralliicola TaxID=3069118 RepID=UPI0027BADE8B|nr:FKBP-type peptidyl-prolyl cis-trans isomerase [Longitalea sp. SCSIO 12813]